MIIRLIIWSAACLALSTLFFGELGTKLPEWLSPAGLYRYGAFHWGVLCLCILWLWLKRKAIFTEMQTGKLSLPFILTGVTMLTLSILLPKRDDFLVFMMLLGWLGVFTIIFAEACIIPSILLAIYGFSLAFPMLITQWLEEPSAIMTTNTVTAITRLMGLPVTSRGIVLHFTTISGDTISTVVSVGCAGYATIGVFIALFTLMMLDIRLPLSRAWYIFLFGLVGTWLQNIIRIVVSVVAGYYWGAGALETTHNNISYVIFPLWYLLFAFVYLKQAGWSSRATKKEKVT